MLIFLFLLFFAKYTIGSLLVDVANIPASNCTKYQLNLADSISQYMECAIKNARPITFCESCINEYLSILKDFDSLKNNNGEEGNPCIQDYVNLDRLGVVKTLYENSLDLWTRAKCNECFLTENGKLTNTSSKAAENFKNLLQSWKTCYNANDTTDKCIECLESYVNLNRYYHDVSNENERIGGCMDIVDVMNQTRQQWDDKCCNYRQSSQIIFLISCCVTIFLAISFYFCVKLFDEKKSPTILKQTRLTTSLSQNHIIN